MATQFRQLGTEDVESLVSHLVAWHREDGATLDPIYARREMRRILTDNVGWHAWLIESSGQAIGYLALSFRRGAGFDAPRASLAGLYVVPGARSANIARQAHSLVMDLGRWLHVRIFECDASRQDRHVPALTHRLVRTPRWFDSIQQQASA